MIGTVRQELSLAWMREKAAAKEKEKPYRKSRKNSLKFTLNHSLSGTEGHSSPRNSKRKLEEQEQGGSARKLTRNSEKVSERVPKTCKCVVFLVLLASCGDVRISHLD